MRRKHIATAVFSLPLAHAFSLASFQPITSGLVPVFCALSYNTEIPTCVTNDFNFSCSRACKQALKDTADDVQQACFGLIVNSRSLLGIVQAGGIVNALCVKGGDDTTTTTARPITTTAVQTTTTRPPIQTTTSIPPVFISTSIRTTTTSSTFQTSIQPLPTTSTTIQPVIVPSSNIQPTAGLGPVPSDILTSAPPATTTTPSSRDPQGGGGSGGGSPFDLVNQNSGSFLERSSAISAMVLGGWTLLFFAR